jgi:hypothetical protein
MGVRPPSNNVDDEPDTIEFGIAELDARIEERNISFPVTVADLAAEHGELSVDVDAAGHEMMLHTALEECSTDSFDSRQELLNALHPVFEQRRQEISNSVFGRLRTLLPF